MSVVSAISRKRRLISFFSFNLTMLAHDYFETRSIFLWCNSPRSARASSLSRLPYHTQRRIILGTTPLVEWSARRRDLYLTIHNTHNRQTSLPLPAIRTCNSSKRSAADRRLRQRGHWYRQLDLISGLNYDQYFGNIFTGFYFFCFFFRLYNQ